MPMKRKSSSKTEKSISADFLKNIAFFACLSDKEISELERIIVKKRFSKNDIILLEEDTSNYMYLMYSGKVKAVQISEDGKEQILAIHNEGEFFGEMSFLDGKTSPATVIAMEDTHIGLVSKKDFDKYLLNNSRALKEIISLLCSRLRESWFRLKVLSFADSEQRVRMVLNLLSEQSGINDTRGTIIPLKLTHKDIAAYASVSRETVTRLLDRLLKDGDIEFIENKNILLKPSFKENTPLM
jgi:CRP/FNR family transcriptional regulator